ncbi:MAG: hypothetical protein AAGJ32_02835 [Pseudomonadota bacterium]
MKHLKSTITATALTIAATAGFGTGVHAQDTETSEAEAEAAPSILDGPYAQVQGTWAVAQEICATAPWQIAGNEFTTGSVGAACSFDPAALTISENRSQTVTSFAAPATCAFGEDTSDWNYTFMLSRSGQTLWVSASNALERTLTRCGPEDAAGEGDTFPG